MGLVIAIHSTDNTYFSNCNLLYYSVWDKIAEMCTKYTMNIILFISNLNG